MGPAVAWYEPGTLRNKHDGLFFYFTAPESEADTYGLEYRKAAVHRDLEVEDLVDKLLRLPVERLSGVWLRAVAGFDGLGVLKGVVRVGVEGADGADRAVELLNKKRKNECMRDSRWTKKTQVKNTTPLSEGGGAQKNAITVLLYK